MESLCAEQVSQAKAALAGAGSDANDTPLVSSPATSWLSFLFNVFFFFGERKIRNERSKDESEMRDGKCERCCGSAALFARQ